MKNKHVATVYGNNPAYTTQPELSSSREVLIVQSKGYDSVSVPDEVKHGIIEI